MTNQIIKYFMLHMHFQSIFMANIHSPNSQQIFENMFKIFQKNTLTFNMFRQLNYRSQSFKSQKKTSLRYRAINQKDHHKSSEIRSTAKNLSGQSQGTNNQQNVIKAHTIPKEQKISQVDKDLKEKSKQFERENSEILNNKNTHNILWSWILFQKFRENSEKFSAYFDWKFLINSFFFSWSLILTYFGLTSFIEQSYRNQMVRRYSKIQLPQPFINSPIYEEMKKIIDLKVRKEFVKIIGGCPGIGKTITILQILLQMKENGQQVYYFSFGDSSDKQIAEEQQKKLYGLLSGIQKKYRNKQKYKGKKVKIVLDDINKLQKKSTFNQIMQNLYKTVSSDQIDLILISSSSRFIDNQIRHQLWNSYCSKFGRIFVIQDCKNKQMLKKFHIKIVYQESDGRIKQLVQEGKKYDNPIAVQIAEMNLTTRRVKQFTRSLLDSQNQIQIDQKRSINYLKNMYLTSVKKASIVITNIIINKNKNHMRLLLKQLLQVKEQLQLDGCLKIEDKLYQYQSNEYISKILEQFQNKNLLIFCRPKNLLQRQAFLRVFNSFKNKKDLLKDEQ